MRVVILCLLVAYAAAQNSYQPAPTPKTCSKTCPENSECEIQSCEVCVPKVPTCKTHKCKENEKCEDRPTGPVCVPRTCADIKCAAGELCNDLPDGPDCVPDVPSCKDFFCRRGTNCYIRDGSPVCLPNTCEVRVCARGLSCIDTPSGALCRKGQSKLGCERRYCPANTKCVDTEPMGPHCAKI
ncbi:spore coat protein SP60-like [Pollicipes pollicipes]|uniref:spore coat protein SP60-like n=1 Tax=Pollicipes pollicipes TaxID=41117 RepID=UPI001884CEDB|nr:spore coat protein SP60-like [Pollicipes pollicipes]